MYKKPLLYAVFLSLAAIPSMADTNDSSINSINDQPAIIILEKDENTAARNKELSQEQEASEQLHQFGEDAARAQLDQMIKSANHHSARQRHTPSHRIRK